MRKHPLIETAPVLLVLIALALSTAAIARHPSALQGGGSRLLSLDIILLMVYGIVAMWLRSNETVGIHTGIRLGSVVGLLVGAVLVSNHVTELFVPARTFALVIAPVFLTVALLAAVGSAAMERTMSVLAAVVAGEWCAMVGALVLLCVGFAMDLIAEARVELWLQGAYARNGMSDAGGFVVKNTLESAFEILVRLPVMALFLSLLGAGAHALISKGSRTVSLVALGSALLMLLGGAAALWYSNGLPRSFRPPYVMGGVFLASTALSAMFPIWTTLRSHFFE